MNNDSLNWQKITNEIISCHVCQRLVEWRERVTRVKRRAYINEIYWGKPVPGFGDQNGRILAVGLAPGAHGSNRTGRMFTGDSAGNFLYRALYEANLANQPSSQSIFDGLKLFDVFISSICRCVPPGNKPTNSEINSCFPFLEKEISLLHNIKVIVALGRIAYQYLFDFYSKKRNVKKISPFSHGEVYDLGKDFPFIIASYHPSQQNTQTGRLTKEMFACIWEKAKIYAQIQ